jgi:hypothetical protein
VKEPATNLLVLNGGQERWSTKVADYKPGYTIRDYHQS